MRNIGSLFTAIACMAMSGPANASSFIPPGSFTATGTTSMSAPGFPTLVCTATFVGTVDAGGVATVTSATFTGGQLGVCSLVRVALPIVVIANSTTSVTVKQLQILAPVSCGPQDVPASWANGSPSHFDIYSATVNPGGCVISAHLTVPGVVIM